MKKALVVFLMLALVSSVFAAEPVADVNIAEFSGNASVQWGIDLDSGKTGFKNAYEVVFKLNLLNNGTKSTTGDGVWGELVLKTDGDTFVGWKNESHGDGAFAPGEGMGNMLNWKVFVDVAKMHFGPAYIGIKSGDTETGKLKMDAAIRSADDDQSIWLSDVGPTGFSQGIVAGFENNMFAIDIDLRSYEVANNQYTDAYAFAAEAEFKGVENLSIKAGASYNFSDKFYPSAAANGTSGLDTVLGYSASAGYKLALNDTYYIRPQLGMTGANAKNADTTAMDMAFGVLFGWGDIGIDDDPDVNFLDNDYAKKISPGVSVVGRMPLVNKTGSVDNLENGRWLDLGISVFSGEIVKNLTAALYADLSLPIGFDNVDPGMAAVFGIKYDIPVDAITITPNLGIRFANDIYKGWVGYGGNHGEKLITNNGDWSSDGKNDDGVLNLKAGVDIGGLISNTTLSVIYESRNLMNTLSYANPNNPKKLGTLNLKAKISL